MKSPALHALTLCLGFTLTDSGHSQGTPADRHLQAVNQIKEKALEMSARCLNDIQTLEDWRNQRKQWKDRLLFMLGLEPMPKKTPLQPEVTGRLDRPKHTIEKLVFQSMPGLYVTGHFYLPKELKRPLPTVLYLCGHAPHPLGAKVHYQDRAAWYADNGFACLILDTLEFGEIPGIHHGTHDLNMWNWVSQGYTPAGTEVWNAIRAMDYLETRPEVDANRIGLTGISGGGAITWYTAAVDDRVQAAAPVCSTITYGSQAEHWRAFGQCDCIYYPNTYEMDFPVVAALVAPRPLLILSGRKDADFPPEGYHEVFNRARRVYQLYPDDVQDRIREIDEDVGHTDSPLFLNESRKWMWKWLGNDSRPFPKESFPLAKMESEDMACMNGIPRNAVNFSIHNRFVPTASATVPNTLDAWSARRDSIMADLNQKVFRWFPEESIPFKTETSNHGAGWVPRYCDYRDVTFQTEEGVRVRAQIMTPRHGEESPWLIYVKKAGDSFYFMDMDEVLPLLGRYAVMILHPRFTESVMTSKEHSELERTAMWTGRTIGTMQVWDILRAVDWAVKEGGCNGNRISVYGKGEAGIFALYAALQEERIRQVVLNDPPDSHWRGAAMLNVLRISDIPEIAGLLAPRDLSFVTPPSSSFGPTQTLYGMYESADSFTQTSSLPEALRIWNYPLERTR